jgi:hypothetical protein
LPLGIVVVSRVRARRLDARRRVARRHDDQQIIAKNQVVQILDKNEVLSTLSELKEGQRTGVETQIEDPDIGCGANNCLDCRNYAFVVNIGLGGGDKCVVISKRADRRNRRPIGRYLVSKDDARRHK